MVRREIAPTSQALQVAFSRLFREPMLSESTSFGSRWGIYEMGSRDHVHAKPGPGEAGRLRRSLPERLDLRLPLRRGLRELAPGDLVAGRRHRPSARALRADRGHAGAARDASADGERAGRSYADQGARTARLYGPELRPAHPDLGDPGSPRLWRYPGRVLPAGKIRGRGKQTPNSSENSRHGLWPPAYNHFSRLLATSSACSIARALLRVSSYSREGTESATTPPPAWK